MKQRAMWLGTISRLGLENEEQGRKQIQELMDILAEAGTTVLYPQLRNHDNTVGWDSDIEENCYGFDVLKIFLEEGATRGIRVEPWICMWGDDKNLHPEWQGKAYNGKSRSRTASWMCPARPEVHDYFFNLCTEVMDKYDVGIHLDYIRYYHEPCYCDFHIQDFYEKTGIKIDEILNKEKRAAWHEYNNDTITRFVERISKEVRSRGREISAAVFPALFPPEKANYVDPENGWHDYLTTAYTWNGWCGHCRIGESKACHDCNLEIAVFQDWSKWCAEGYLDVVLPMNYQRDWWKFQKSANATLDYANGTPVVQGLGIYPTLGPSVDGLVDQIKHCRAQGMDGVSFFDAKRFMDFTPEERARLAKAWK